MPDTDKTTDPTPFARLQREQRKTRRMSIQDLADATGISKTWLGHVERGYQAKGAPAKPSEEVIIAVATALGLDINKALTMDGHPPIALVTDIPPPNLDEIWPDLTLQQKQFFDWFLRLMKNPRADYQPLPTRPDTSTVFVSPPQTSSGSRRT